MLAALADRTYVRYHGSMTAPVEIPLDPDDERFVAPEPTPAQIVPSGWLAVELDTRYDDPSTLDDASVIDALVGYERLVGWAQARQARLMAELDARRGDDAAMAIEDKACALSRYAPDEIGVALHWSRGTAAGRVGDAVRLTTQLSATLELWEAGRLDARKVSAICDAALTLSAEHVPAVEARVLRRAPEQTLAQLKAALKRAVIAVYPAGAAERHDTARAQRRVVINPEPDGMASMWALLSAPDALASYEWLTRLARGLGASDPRCMHARRADLLVDLLTGRLRHADHGQGLPVPVRPGAPLVHVVVGLATLRGTSTEPAELVGHGPVHAELAREIAADATWERLVADPLSGALLDHGRTTYTPPRALAEFVRARDVYCRFPGCRRQARHGELDHVIPYPAGPTSEVNLAAYCVHHHHLKHEAGWQVRMLPGGSLEWITPAGHRHTTRPHDHRGVDPP